MFVQFCASNKHAAIFGGVFAKFTFFASIFLAKNRMGACCCENRNDEKGGGTKLEGAERTENIKFRL